MATKKARRRVQIATAPPVVAKPPAASPVVQAQQAAPVVPAAPAGGVVDLDWNEVGGLMDEATAKANAGLAALGGRGAAGGGGGLSGLGGGGGSFTFRSSGGGGSAMAIPTGLSSKESELMKLDPKYQAAFAALGEEAKGMQGKVYDLDPEMRAQLAVMRDAQLARARAAAASGRDQLLTRLYAGGNQQSTMAGEVGSRLLADQSLVESDIEGDSAGRELELRMGITDDARELFGMRGDLAGRSADTALSELGINVDQLESGRDREADMWGKKLQSQTDIEAAGIQAGASAYGADASANASKFNALIGLFGETARTKEGARQFDLGLDLDRDKFDADTGFRREELDFSERDSLRDYDLGKRQVGADRFATRSENDRFGRSLEFDRERYAGDSAFRDREFSEDTRRYDLDYGLERDRFAEEVYDNRHRRSIENREFLDRRRERIGNTTGNILQGIFSSPSDERLKNNILVIDAALSRINGIRGVAWRWKSDNEIGGGVVAQELRAVLPDAVVEDGSGILHVNYQYVIGLLVQGVRELSERVRALEAA